MDTTKKMMIPLKNEYLRNQLRQECLNNLILQIYYHPADQKGYSHLFLMTQSHKDAELIRERKWVTKAFSEHQTKLYVSCPQTVEYQLKKGYPLVYYYTHSSLLIYSKDPVPACHHMDKAGKHRMKRYSSFREEFYHDHDLLKSETDRFHALYSPISTYLMYIRLIEHDLDYLEYMYLGDRRDHKNKHQRIKDLTLHIPLLRKLLVRKNGNTYYLISKLEAALNAAESGDEMDIRTELYSAIQHLESELYQRIEHRFKELKTMLEPDVPVLAVEAEIPETKTGDKNLEMIFNAVCKTADPEEIFLFHTADTFENSRKIRLYYLLVIGEGLGNEKIIRIQDSVQAKSCGSAGVVILSHSRISIQEQLFNGQHLMRQIMTGRNRIFTTDDLHPDIHWEEPHGTEYGDMDLYYAALQGYVTKYFAMRKYVEDNKGYGFAAVFARCVMKAFRVFLYGSLHSYMPHYLNAFSIWKLCVFADPSMEKIEFLFGKLSPDFYRTIDAGLRYTDNIDHCPGEKLLIMDEILDCLMNRIGNLIESKNLQNK
ncbi:MULTISPECIES: hypothetical protein [Chryseobacterium]|uniref:HEPN domain-containing protein n=1 Tax=Chryseobacterium camelliae TaxID=1265445 RepID=A0ABU0THF4_9FLAO|nr:MULTISPECIES: hypothetical protein [Chryseobacterium]MDT3405707.1 hypothetical protein [Pseudacidovorax intermedius]MDQ1096484.1 hypothetical protein [Chryseobacterium camelliae]MDQ1100424.1 hypothetical protein [Chryseobacterium sp. SORGH_AS_1048]MDR6087765.1 hypothetical protein [Chryseobacterium sp. SORGH_AS_0909]MDR6132141.1 hypothetical protein [Chryseobacterium sp. SORGH_AS_1175]